MIVAVSTDPQSQLETVDITEMFISWRRDKNTPHVGGR